MKPESREILNKIKNNSEAFVVFTTTSGIVTDNSKLNKLIAFHHLDKEEFKEPEDLELFISNFLISSLFNNRFPNVITWQKAIGYSKGKLNPDSFIMLVDERSDIKKFVDTLKEMLAQEEVFVFPASAKYQVFKRPVDNCTYLDEKWVKYNLKDAYNFGALLVTKESRVKEFANFLLENSTNNEMTREEILMLGYELSFNYYHPTSFKDSSLEIEDFAQEAFMVLADLYEQGNEELLSINKSNARAVLNHVIKKYVVNDIRRRYRRDYQHISLDQAYSDVGGPKTDDAVDTINMTLDDVINNPAFNASGHILTPDEQYDYNRVYKGLEKGNLDYYRELIIELTTKFTITPYRSRRYDYFFKGNNEFVMSPKSIAALLLKGYSLKEILGFFMPETDRDGNPIKYIGGLRYASHSSPGSFIRDKFHLTKRQLAALISGLDIEDQVFLYEVLKEMFDKRKDIDLDDEFLIEIFTELDTQ